MKITVLFNERNRFDGYYDGDTLRKVFEFELVGDSIDSAQELAFAILNSYPEEMFAPQEFIDVVRDYRAGRNRSLSVGDVLVFDGTQASAVAGIGFEPLPEIPEYHRKEPA